MPRPIHFDGGSDADHTAVLAAHHAYLRANAAFDWPTLKPIWSDDPSNVFFNMNGHTYVGLEHWSQLWQYYAIAGTPDECLAQAEVYSEADVTELAVAPIGDHPCDDISRLGNAMK
jgi:hypothetical protein